MTTPSTRQYEDEIDLLWYGHFLASYWVVIFACAVAGALGGLSISSLIPPRFQANATLIVNPPSGATPFVLSPASSKALVANLTLVSETVNESGLNRGGMTAQSFIDDALEVQLIPTTNLIKITVALSDPMKSQLAATLLANKVVALSRSIDRVGASKALDELEKQIEEAKANLNKAQQRLLEAQDSTEIEVLEAEVKSKLARRVDLDVVETEVETERARLASLEQELARQPAELDVPQVRNGQATNRFSNPVHTMLQYDIAQSRAKISSLERQRRQIIGAMGGATATKQRAELHRRRLELERPQAVYAATSRIYGDLVSRYEDARGKTAGGAPQLQILDAPVVPDQPMPRLRAKWSMFGGIIGMMLGLGAALFINWRRVAQPISM